MKLKWNEYGLKCEKDLLTIIENGSYDYSGGKLEETERKAIDVARFCCRTVDLLYKKGLLDKNDIINLLGGFEYFEDADTLEIITD